MRRTIRRALFVLLTFAAAPAFAIDGTLVSIDGVSGSGIDGFRLTPDGQTIVFVGSLDNGLGDEAYAVPVSGGTPILLSDPNGSSNLVGDIDDPPIADDTYGYYLGDLGSDNSQNAWFRRPLDGSGAVEQISPIDAEADARIVTVGGVSTFLYLNDGALDSPADDEVYSVPNDGSLTATILTPDGVDIDQAQWEVTSDGQTIIYGDNGGSGAPTNFASLPTDGTGTPTPIALTGVAAFAGITDMDLTPDDSTIVFTIDQDIDGGTALYSASVAGGAMTPIVQTTAGNLDVNTFQISPDGTKIALIGDLETNQVFNLYVVNLDGTGFANLTPSIDGDFDVEQGFGDLAWSPDSETIYFVADQIAAGTNQIFAISATTVPEPSAIVVALLAMGGLACMRWR